MSLAEQPMSTRQALRVSAALTPNALEKTIAKQREQLKACLHIADAARADEDLELWATQARNAADVAKALSENLEMQTMSRCTVPEAPDEALTAELVKRAESKGPDAAGAKRALLAAAKRVQQPKQERTRGRS